MHPLRPERDFTVFSASNEDLNEVYVVWTDLPIFRAMAEFAESLPPAIAHWRPETQRVSFRSLEFNLSEDAARQFVAKYVAKTLPEGWRFVPGATKAFGRTKR